MRMNQLSSESHKHWALEALGFVGYRLRDSESVNSVWAYNPHADARRWMECMLRPEWRWESASFNNTTMAMILEEGPGVFPSA